MIVMDWFPVFQPALNAASMRQRPKIGRIYFRYEKTQRAQENPAPFD